MMNEEEETSLSHKQIEEVRRAFDYLDKDNDGRILAEDIMTLLRILGQNPTCEEEEEIHFLHLSDSNNYNVDQVIEIVQRIGLKSKEEVYEELMIAFRAMDADGDGRITKQELEKYMKNVGNPMTQEEVDEMMLLADSDKDGVIDWNEFTTVLCRHVV